MNETFEPTPGDSQSVEKHTKSNKLKILVIIIILLIAGGVFAYRAYYPKYEYQKLTTLSFPEDVKEEDKQYFENSLKQVLEAHKNDPKNAVLYSDIGILKSGLDDYEGAAAAFEKAIELNPQDPRFYRNLAITYTAMEKYEDAEKLFLKVYAEAPNNPEYWLELGELYTFRMKNNDAAKAFYLDALQKTGDEFSVMQAYAGFLDDVLKDYPEAIKYYQILSERSESNKLAYLKRIEELKLKLNQ